MGFRFRAFVRKVVSCLQLNCEKYDTGDTFSLPTAVRPVTALSDRHPGVTYGVPGTSVFEHMVRSASARPERRRMFLTHLCNRSVVNEHPELRLRPRPPEGTARPRRRPFPQLLELGSESSLDPEAPSDRSPTNPGWCG